ncbi:MAG: ChaN family lipoprotein [Desulfurococcales archaeon]|nr:ChaN family lipoprotein [Desulfurococcales archaeon]
MSRLLRMPFLDQVPPGILSEHTARIVFLGEVHERPWLVEAYARLMGEECRRGRLGFLGVEYFNYEQQGILDEWRASERSWYSLVAEYSNGPEGFSLEIYRPLLETARKCGARIIGVMPPRDKARIVTMTGSIPDLPSRAPDPGEYPSEYECLLRALFPREGPMARIPVERLVLAQSYKDSIAAWRVADAYRRYGPGVVVMGWVHVEALGGVASRAARLLGLKPIDWLVAGARETFYDAIDALRLAGCLETRYLLIRE